MCGGRWLAPNLGERLGYRDRLFRGNEERVLRRDDVWHAADSRSHDRYARVHRFKQRDRRALGPGAENKSVKRWQHRAGIRDGTMPENAVADSEFDRLLS